MNDIIERRDVISPVTVQCSNCLHTYQVDGPGSQVCPQCGAYSFVFTRNNERITEAGIITTNLKNWLK